MKFMLHHMKKIECPLTGKHYICRPCDEKVGGHFEIKEGVVLCENRLRTQEQMAETMIHETIHAFDHCRVKMDWHNCRHHACSEIRAANLSGDCRLFNELARGNMNKFYKQHQDCVKRRALLSIQMNPACGGEAEKIIDEVFESCFRDTEPFDEIY